MILFTKCLVFAFWVYIRLPIGIYASEAPIKESESSHTCLIAIMEDIEQVKTTPIREISNFKSEPAQEKPTQENYFSRLPVEVIRHILDMVLLYKDQLSFMLCASGYKDYAKFITRTHIRNLNRKKESTDQSYYLNLLSDLKYLWITSCDISDIVFNTEKLTGLAIRWSNVNPTLLLKQQSLSYLDVRTINKPFLRENSLSYFGISIENPNRMVFSCENETLLKALKNNKNLIVLKLNITNAQQNQKPENIYAGLTKLKSLELVDIVSNQGHAHFLTSLQSLNEIILSAFETGQMEGTYEGALRVIAAMPQQKHLTIKCLNNKEPWKIVYDGIDKKLNPSHYL